MLNAEIKLVKVNQLQAVTDALDFYAWPRAVIDHNAVELGPEGELFCMVAPEDFSRPVKKNDRVVAIMNEKRYENHLAEAIVTQVTPVFIQVNVLWNTFKPESQRYQDLFKVLGDWGV